MFHENYIKINQLTSLSHKSNCLSKVLYIKTIKFILMLYILLFSFSVFSQQEQVPSIYVSPHTIITGINNIHVLPKEDIKKEDEIKEPFNIYVDLKTVFYSADSFQYNVVYREEKNNHFILSNKDNLPSQDDKKSHQEVASTKVETKLTSPPLPELPYKTRHVVTFGLTTSVVSSNSNIVKKNRENVCTLTDFFAVESANVSKRKVKIFFDYKKIRAYTLAIKYCNRPPPYLA